MNRWNWFRSRLANFQARQGRDEELDREMKSHLELEAEEQLESGLSSQEARYAARRAFGNTTLVREDVHAIWNIVWLERFAGHARYAARSLRKKPGFTVIAVLTLALGIGANTAIFSTIDALMLRPLSFSAPDQLVRIYSTKDGTRVGGTTSAGGPSPMDMRDFAQLSHSFQKMVVYDTWRKNVSFGSSAGQPEQMRVGLVPAAYFEALDIQPVMGRLFTEDENQVGKNFVAAISARLWKDRFASDTAILGREIRINDEPYTIVAVMPDAIPEWMEPWRPGLVEVWTPFAFADVWSESSRSSRGYCALARMKPGVSLELAQEELATIAAGLAATHPVNQGTGVILRRVSDTRVGELRPMLLLLMAAVSLILLIACVNLANLLLARNSARQRELAVRAALGAGRTELIRQLLAETLLLSLIGGAVGLALAQIGLAGLTRMHPADLPQLDSMGIDWRVLAFTLVASLATSLLFGVAPALTGTRLNLVDALKQGGRSGSSGSTQRLRNVLVVTEMAMSLMLLVGATLLTRSIIDLERQHLGIRQDHLLKGHVYMPDVRYPNPGAITRFCDAFATRVRSVPGVIDATVTTVYPPNDGWTQMLNIPGHPFTRIQDVPTAQFGLADAHFLKTLGIPLIQGRDFAESDTATSPAVALISEEFKRRYFPTEDPVGRQIHIGPPPSLQIAPGADITDSADVAVIGIVGDFRNAGLVLPPEPQIIVLYSQHPLVNYGFKDIVTRTALDPRLLVPEIRRQLHDLDPDMPFAEVQTMDEIVKAQTGGQRFTTLLLASFAAAGLVLAVVGIYGVVSFLVAQRKQELAVRIALGANRVNVVWLVLRQGLKMAALGAAIGLFGAWATQKLVKGFLFGISPVDPVTFAGAAVFLLTIATIASLIPGARVLRIDPAQALRQD
jgi:predicted permease